MKEKCVQNRQKMTKKKSVISDRKVGLKLTTKLIEKSNKNNRKMSVKNVRKGD